MELMMMTLIVAQENQQTQSWLVRLAAERGRPGKMFGAFFMRQVW
jgi:hypothetical protein